MAEARAFVGSATTALDPGVRRDLQLMASELCTNAVRHGSAPVIISVDCHDHEVTVVVTDAGSEGRPARQSAGADDATGRGLQIVEELADEWGTSQGAHNETVVWFRKTL